MENIGITGMFDLKYLSETTYLCSPFSWGSMNEDEKTYEAVNHLSEQLFVSAPHIYGEEIGKFQIYDTHTRRNLLNIDHIKLGKISGGVDAIIAPYSTSIDFVQKNACVIFEFKKALNNRAVSSKRKDQAEIDDVSGKISALDILPDSDSRKPASSSSSCAARAEEFTVPSQFPQLLTEALAASLLSCQPVLSILTDLHSDLSVALVFLYDSTQNKFSANRYLNLTLSQMISLVNSFLLDYCKPSDGLVPENQSNSKEHQQVLNSARYFRKCLQSDMSLTEEQFNDHIGDTVPGSIERAQLIHALFQSQGLESQFLREIFQSQGLESQFLRERQRLNSDYLSMFS
jgi:hypothetical protein